MLPRDDSFQRRTTKNRNRDSEVSYRSDRERAGSYLMSHCELDEDTIRDMVLMEKELKMSPEVILVMSLVPGMPVLLNISFSHCMKWETKYVNRVCNHCS